MLKEAAMLMDRMESDNLLLCAQSKDRKAMQMPRREASMPPISSQ